jgi:hypothetical protein
MQRQTVSSKAVRPEAEANVRGSRVVLQEIIIAVCVAVVLVAAAPAGAAPISIVAPM